MQSDDNVIKVSGSSSPQSVASILARAVVAGQTDIKLRAIGASAVNQSTKAAAIARGFVAPRGIDLLFLIGFDDVPGTDGGTISSMTWQPVVRS